MQERLGGRRPLIICCGKGTQGAGSRRGGGSRCCGDGWRVVLDCFCAADMLQEGEGCWGKAILHEAAAGHTDTMPLHGQTKTVGDRFAGCHGISVCVWGDCNNSGSWSSWTSERK